MAKMRRAMLQCCLMSAGALGFRSKRVAPLHLAASRHRLARVFSQTTEAEAAAAAVPSFAGNLVDAHCHLIHERFPAAEADAAAERAASAGVEYAVVNGLDPESNRAVLDLCARHENLLAAVGIYPLDACSNVIDRAAWDHDFEPPEAFDVDAEVRWIADRAREGSVAAIGECGLDAFYLSDAASLAEQERVLGQLMDVAKEFDLPLILHTRKAEARTFEMLKERGVERAVFHCYMGKVKLAKRIAEAGYLVSIPSAIARPHQTFEAVAKQVPLEALLTETDSPYMGPEKGQRNEPATVPRGVAAIARVKGIAPEAAERQIRDNFRRAFKL